MSEVHNTRQNVCEEASHTTFSQKDADTEIEAAAASILNRSSAERRNTIRQYADLTPLRLLGRGTYGKVKQSTLLPTKNANFQHAEAIMSRYLYFF